MSQVEKIVFIADKIEPQKIKKYPELGSIMDIVMDDLDGAILRYLALRIRSILANGGVVHPRALETWNWLILKRNSCQ
jgi:HD superfamily phosphohydrolase YqeK